MVQWKQVNVLTTVSIALKLTWTRCHINLADQQNMKVPVGCVRYHAENNIVIRWRFGFTPTDTNKREDNILDSFVPSIVSRHYMIARYLKNSDNEIWNPKSSIVHYESTQSTRTPCLPWKLNRFCFCHEKSYCKTPSCLIWCIRIYLIFRLNFKLKHLGNQNERNLLYTLERLLCFVIRTQQRMCAVARREICKLANW